jgi:NIPSNAP
MITQLRVYTINKGRLDDFVKAWTAGVYPLRLKMGFRIDGAWVNRKRNEFIWLLRHDGDDWEALEKAYYASPERAAVNPDPAQYIAKAEKWFVTPVVPHSRGSV